LINPKPTFLVRAHRKLIMGIDVGCFLLP